VKRPLLANSGHQISGLTLLCFAGPIFYRSLLAIQISKYGGTSVIRHITKRFLLPSLVFFAAFSVTPTPGYTQNSRVCDGYARDFAQRHSRGRAARGGVIGAVGGGLIGGIAGGGRGAGIGALVGGGAGLAVGGSRQREDFNALYNRAYNDCMRA
jgi:uncharacterized membrane protein